jgi:transposase-like protein
MPSTNSLTHSEPSEHRQEGVTSHDAKPPVQKSKPRKKFTAAEKLSIVKAAAACPRGQLEALLRREGIYSSHLTSWRLQLGMGGKAGLEPKKPGRKKTRIPCTNPVIDGVHSVTQTRVRGCSISATEAALPRQAARGR